MRGNDMDYTHVPLKPAFTVQATYKIIGKLKPRQFPLDESNADVEGLLTWTPDRLPESEPTFVPSAPVNRQVKPEWVPAAGRPNWWRDRFGVEHYLEPPKPEKS